MKKQKKKYAKCHCCLTEVHRTEMKICLSILEKRDRKMYKFYKELNLNLDAYDSFIDNSFEWACDACLNNKKAILANPALQINNRDPHLAYSDKEIDCNACGTQFQFTKEEKQVWFEQYQFRGDYEPVNCLNCRREIRLLKNENKILSDILKKSENEISMNELKIISDIYRNWGKIEKAKFYEAIGKKRMKMDL